MSDGSSQAPQQAMAYPCSASQVATGIGTGTKLVQGARPNALGRLGKECSESTEVCGMERSQAMYRWGRWAIDHGEKRGWSRLSPASQTSVAFSAAERDLIQRRATKLHNQHSSVFNIVEKVSQKIRLAADRGARHGQVEPASAVCGPFTLPAANEFSSRKPRVLAALPGMPRRNRPYVDRASPAIDTWAKPTLPWPPPTSSIWRCL